MSRSTTSGSVIPAQFIARWREAQFSKRAASREHFIDRYLLSRPTPAEHDSADAKYTFAKDMAVASGEEAHELVRRSTVVEPAAKDPGSSSGR